MNWKDYINKFVGRPWVNRSYGPDSFDCYGLLIHSYFTVDDIEIPIPDSYMSGEPIELCGNGNKSNWIKSSIDKATAFACYKTNGDMVHVGRVTPFGLLHASGKDGQGAVALHKANQLDRIMKVTTPGYSHIEYYRFDNANN